WKEEQKPSSGIREPWLHVELLNIVNINSHIKRLAGLSQGRTSSNRAFMRRPSDQKESFTSYLFSLFLPLGFPPLSLPLCL
ncbi:hypothetical protein KUCAC02_022596, partial [Chaenocephalus aceratus]